MDRVKQAEAENKALRAENEKLKADQFFIAMMTDVELETVEEDSTPNNVPTDGGNE